MFSRVPEACLRGVVAPVRDDEGMKAAAVAVDSGKALSVLEQLVALQT